MRGVATALETVSELISGKKNPDLPFLAFLEFLVSFPRNSLLFQRFSFFPRDFRGSLGKIIHCFLVVVLIIFHTKKTRKRRSGKSTKINFLGPETARWGGGLPREGVVAEKFVPSLDTLFPLGFEGSNLGCPEKKLFAGMNVFKKFVQKKVRAHFSFPIIN